MYTNIRHLMRKYLAIFIFSLIAQLSFSQRDTILLRKPSFEQMPLRGGEYGRILGWFDCGRVMFRGETPPDIHPNNYWLNNVPALEGDTYLGMVTRDNETWESISQPLAKPLKGGHCYRFSLLLAKSDRYVSGSRSVQDPKQLFNYVQPVVLRIWGGKTHCDTRELLAESDPVRHKDWRRYEFKFEPRTDLKYFMIEAFYKTPTLFPYNGHVLVDGLSPIIEVNCDIQEELAEKELALQKEQPAIATNTRKPKKSTVITPKREPKTTRKDRQQVTTSTRKTRILKDLDKSKIKQGQKIKIENLYFEADTSTISESSYAVLDEIRDFLAQYKDVKVEIGGHTNGTPKHSYCDKLSTDRAKAVADYLIEKGVNRDQITYKGYGKRKPIANNFTTEGRIKNQRVEIKILSLG